MSPKLLLIPVVLLAGEGLYGQPDRASRFEIQWLTVCPTSCAFNPFGITGRGTISGNVATPQGERGFLLQHDGSITYVDTPGNILIELLKGNNSGEFVGNYFSPADSLVHAFVRDRNGLLRSFVHPGAAVTVAGGITESGAVVGCYTADPTTATGWVSFIEKNGSFPLTFQYPHPQASGTIALGMNEQGSIVGVFTLTGSSALHAFQRNRHGGFLEITFPAAQETYLADINDSGVAAGFWRDQSGVYHGLLYADGLCRSVDPPLSPSGYKNSTFNGINNAAQMVGVSFATSPGDGDGFLMTAAGNQSASVVPGPPIPCAVPRP